MIRPETIGIVSADAGSLTGTVETVRFAGDRLRITVRDAAINVLAVEAPNAIAVGVGDRIGLSISPDAIRVLPAEGQ
jgi:putative spermidine/putrescine transport system ATP-binding protein